MALQTWAFLLLLPLTSSLHVFLSSSRLTLATKTPFHLVIQGSDCPYNPCFYTATVDGQTQTTGNYENATESISFTIIKPGLHKIIIYFSDTDTLVLAYGVTSTGEDPLIFVMDVELEESSYCNSVRFTVGGVVVKNIGLAGDTDIVIDILNSLGEVITKEYYYSGVVQPTVEFRNTTTVFSKSIQPDPALEAWRLHLTTSLLLLSRRTTSPASPAVPHRDWYLEAKFPSVYVASCKVHSALLTVSFLSDIFTSPASYFGEAVVPLFGADVPLQSRQSPCSRSLLLVFQPGSPYFGIAAGDSVQWFSLANLDVLVESGALILDLVVLPDGVVVVTTRGVVTVGEDATVVRSGSATTATITAYIQCPTVARDVVTVTLDQEEVISASYPYQDWSNWLTDIAVGPGCRIVDAYQDAIRDIGVVTQECDGGVTVRAEEKATGTSWTSHVGISQLSGVHWHSFTSTLYVFGSHVKYSTTRGRSFFTALSVSDGGLVRQMVSEAYSGDILAVTDTGRLFLSNVAVNRFTELHNLHNTPLTPLSFYTLDQHSQLVYLVLQDTTLLRYGIPTRSVVSSNYRSGSPLLLEILGRNRIRLVSPGEESPFQEEDLGKVFQLAEGQGAGRIVDVSQVTTSDQATHSAAVLEITQPFLRRKTSKTELEVADNGDGTVTISIKGGEWLSTDIRSCITVLHCTPFLVENMVNSTALVAKPLYPDRVPSCLGEVYSNKWFQVNLDRYKSSTAQPMEARYTVTDNENNLVNLASTKPIPSGVAGGIVTFNNRRSGIVNMAFGKIIMISSSSEFELHEEFASWEVSFSVAATGMLAEQYPRLPSWIVTEPECDVVFVGDDLANLTQPAALVTSYIDTWQEGVISVKVSDKRWYPNTDPQFQVMFDNRDVFKFYSTINTTSHVTQYSLHLTHNSTTGGLYTPVLITSHTASLQCQVPALLFNLHRECNPQTRLVHRFEDVHSPERLDMLLDKKDETGNSLVFKLPVNYRPPSIHGREISNSSNVYNANPAKPVKRTSKAFNNTKESYRFQQCEGKEAEGDCGCTDEMRWSGLSVDSDCRQIVYMASYKKIIFPKLFIEEFGHELRAINNSYIIKEINGRKEFEIEVNNRTANGTNRGPSPDNNCNHHNCSIQFLGSELFHFRITIVSDTICPYETEFLIYVNNHPLTTTQYHIITVLVGLVVLLIILAYYLSISTKEKLQKEREEAILKKARSEQSSSYGSSSI